MFGLGPTPVNAVFWRGRGLQSVDDPKSFPWCDHSNYGGSKEGASLVVLDTISRGADKQ